jgi:hypothetical protein
MRSVTYTFAAALLAAVCQSSVANAQTPPDQSSQADTPQEQAPAPADPAPSPDDPTASNPDQKLDAAAAAMRRVAT